MLVEAETIKADQELAYVEACSKLNEKFGMKRETAIEMMEEALSGKVLPEKDAGALLNLYATLSSIHTMAKETGREKEFENRTAIDAVLKKKVPHYAGKWTKKSVNCQIDECREPSFSEFLNFLNKEHRFLDQFNRSMAGTSGPSGAKTGNGSAKVAAATATAS